MRLLILEREGESARQVDLADLTGHMEVFALGGPHLDPVALADARGELHACDGVALRPKPLPELVRIHERLKHNRTSRRELAPEGEREPV